MINSTGIVFRLYGPAEGKCRIYAFSGRFALDDLVPVSLTHTWAVFTFPQQGLGARPAQVPCRVSLRLDPGTPDHHCLMPNPASAEEFIRLAEESGVVEKAELDKALKGLEGQGAALSDASTLANSLVSSHTLTRWQAEKLLEGRHQGFVLGKYRLLSLLGKGSMGTVYLAEHLMMHRQVALKVLPFDHVEQPAFLDRFLREAQAGAALDHPNIVRAYDVGKENEGKRDVYYLAMEYVDGDDLSALVRKQGPLEFVKAADFLRQIADGLDHAHDKGLVHRDVKPGNLLVDRNDVVRILDLGLAVFHSKDQDEAASLTVTNNDHLLGTADYISPEQALNSHEVDHRSDIYSLGCTFYFMLTGHPPFRHGTVPQRLLAHQSKEPAPISESRPDFPEELARIARKMLAKSPADRYQSCGAIAEDLTNWLRQHTDRSWQAAHLEQPATTNGSVLEGPSRANGSSDTIAGPSPFGDEPEHAVPVAAVVSRANSKDSRAIRIAATVVGLLLLIAGVALFLNSDSGRADNDEPTIPGPASVAQEDETTTPPGKIDDVDSPGPQVTETVSSPAETPEEVQPTEPESVPQPMPAPLSPFEKWQELSSKLKSDPTTVLYLSFEEPGEGTEPVPNETTNGKIDELKLTPHQPLEWTAGRWSDVPALRFGGTQEGQYLAVSNEDSAAFNITGSLSAMAWVRIDSFPQQCRYMTIVSKGDYGFRLARMEQSPGLAFAVNRYVGKGQQLPPEFSPMTEVFDREITMDDGNWHLAVGVVDADDDEVTVSLFVDGELLDRKASEAPMRPNPAQVLIGANSFFLRDLERTRANGIKVFEHARQFQGDIDEIAVLGRALSAEEIRQMYEIGRPQ